MVYFLTYLRYFLQGGNIMEVTFSINFDLSKKEQNKKHNSNCTCGCNEESNLEKWLDTAQKFVKTIKVK